MIAGYHCLWYCLFAASIRNPHHRDRLAHLPIFLTYRPVQLASEEEHPDSSSKQNGEGRNGTTVLLELPPTLLSSLLVENDDAIRSMPGASFPPVLVGDKRGRVRILQFDVEKDDDDANNDSVAATVISTLTDDSAQPGLPVFSVAVEEETATVFVGGGDRYVSVWQREQQSRVRSWNRIQRLGPHTGWVKSIATRRGSPNNGRPQPRIYSIGCNRIETWEPCSFHDGDQVGWRHFETISIDSSPSKEGAACTLSSDLLSLTHCYCSVAFGAQASSPSPPPVSILAAGGVDGRIHFFWNSDDEDGKMKPATFVSAHNGRVNALHFDFQCQVLFSVSHDGSIRCWSLKVNDDETSGSRSLSVSLVAWHNIGPECRITALSCWQDCQNSNNSEKWHRPIQDGSRTIVVAVGTQNGLVGVLSFRRTGERHPQSKYQFALLRKIQIADKGTDADDTPVVSALCPLLQYSPGGDESSRTALVVGHSRGLGFISSMDLD